MEILIKIVLLCILLLTAVIVVFYVSFASRCECSERIINKVANAVDLLGEMQGVENFIDGVDKRQKEERKNE